MGGGAGAAPGLKERVANYFDETFYLSQNPDVASARVEPLWHYLKHGWREGRDPSPAFNTRFYQQKYAALLGDRCPLLHYVEEGRDAGFLTSPIEEFEYFISQYSGDIERFIGRISLEPNVLQGRVLRDVVTPMFSADEVRQRHGLPETVSDSECFIRYLVFDFGRGLRPGPLFDGGFYCSQARARSLCPPADPDASFLHWLKFGIPNRISPVSWYNDESYQDLNPDLLAYPEWPFFHFIQHGLNEGRSFLPTVAITAAVHPQNQTALARDFIVRMAKRPDVGSILQANLDFWRSPEMAEIMARAILLEPEIQAPKVGDLSLMAPWHDDNYRLYELIRRQVPGTYANVIFTPFCKLGGADFVGGVLARSLVKRGKTILIRTDQSDWARPDWFPTEMDTVDLSKWLQPLSDAVKKRVLYELIRALEPKNVFNVNSRMAFETFVDYGARLQLQTNLFCYYFCADRTPAGQEAGYPVSFFANILPFLKAALLDTEYLKEILSSRLCLPDELRKKLVVLRTPRVSQAEDEPLVDAQLARRGRRARPVLLWTGRLDRQKRFDLVVEIARAMPDVSFQCWGKAVLDAEPSRDNFPSNLILNAPFKNYEELPLRDCDGLLYTSAWDGMPTILIEFAGLGMPIVASSVGGVPELIDETTGWPVPECAGTEEYVAIIRRFLASTEQRAARARRLQERVRANYTREAYDQALGAFLQQDGRND